MGKGRKLFKSADMIKIKLGQGALAGKGGKRNFYLSKFSAAGLEVHVPYFNTIFDLILPILLLIIIWVKTKLHHRPKSNRGNNDVNCGYFKRRRGLLYIVILDFWNDKSIIQRILQKSQTPIL